VRVRITLTFTEPDFRVLRWVLAAVIRLHAEAPAAVQVTTEVDRDE
jgi:hypothetical protein